MEQKILFLTLRERIQKSLKWILLSFIISALCGYGLYCLLDEILSGERGKAFSPFLSLVSFAIPSALLFYQRNLINKLGQVAFLLLISASLGLFWFWMINSFEIWIILVCVCGAIVLFISSIWVGLRIKKDVDESILFLLFMIFILLSMMVEFIIFMVTDLFSNYLIITSTTLVLWFTFANACTFHRMKQQAFTGMTPPEIKEQSIETAIEMAINIYGMIWIACHVKFLLYFINPKARNIKMPL